MSVNDDEIPKEMPGLVSNSYTPKIFWYQKANLIYIRIPLVDVTDYYLEVGYQKFKFTTLLGDKNYLIAFELFGTVLPENTTHGNYGREIRICIEKALKWTDWPRLVRSKDKNHFIAVDPDYIDKKSWDDPTATLGERESFQEYKERMGIKNIGPPSSSSEESSGDEDTVYYDD